ncbi:PaaI family thioesterase [Frisingicoccus sp.]|uniref:PaaI family thioesterase n=1 Tax=Frisingicoccus sp. TaxID=1918627 RepID=UPI003AB2EC5D
MRITKILLNGVGESLIFSYPENTVPGDEDFKIGFSLNRMAKDEKIHFGSDRVSSYHVLLEGWTEVLNSKLGKRAFETGQTFSCEEEEQVELTGEGRVFNMFMSGGVRGFIRKMPLEKEKKMRAGEAMGGCVMAFFGFDGEFSLMCSDEKLVCEAGSAVIIQADKQEFFNLNIIPEKAGMSVACVTGVMLNSHDFGKYIGVHLLERSEGTCRARLDICPNHMNPIGTVHGGCLFTLADAVCGIAASSLGGICTTVNSNIQFLNAAFYPKYLVAEAKPKKIGRKIRTFLVEIRDDRDILICTVDMVFYSLQQ